MHMKNCFCKCKWLHMQRQLGEWQKQKQQKANEKEHNMHIEAFPSGKSFVPTTISANAIVRRDRISIWNIHLEATNIHTGTIGMCDAGTHEGDQIHTDTGTKSYELHVAKNDCIAILLSEITWDAPARQNKNFRNDETLHEVARRRKRQAQGPHAQSEDRQGCGSSGTVVGDSHHQRRHKSLLKMYIFLLPLKLQRCDCVWFIDGYVHCQRSKRMEWGCTQHIENKERDRANTANTGQHLQPLGHATDNSVRLLHAHHACAFLFPNAVAVQQ